MSGNVKITGAPTTRGPNGAVPLRHELTDLQNSRVDQFNVFILGMRALQVTDESQPTSYYQVAGIHGMPFKPWNNVSSKSNDWTSDGFGGYCTHSSVLFAPWHRPYLALFEQALYKAVQDVAGQFPQSIRQRYMDAARDFRLPYFDWAAHSGFPDVMSRSTVRVVDVDGQTKDINNPLHAFSFHPVNPQQGDFNQQWSQYPTTLRYPKGNTSQDNRIGPILRNENASLRTNVATILLQYTSFDAFSSNQWDPSVGHNAFGSLEDIHNEIHDKTGGGGHMSALEVAAFDPLFWLHHCNVDRLWAIWQDLHPNSFIQPEEAPYSTFGVEKGETQTQDSPLAPFWDNTGSEFWTSAQVKDSTTLGYAYPETQKWNYSSAKEYQQRLRQTVVGLYGGNVFSNFVQRIAPSGAPSSTQSAAQQEQEQRKQSVNSAALDPAAMIQGGAQKVMSAMEAMSAKVHGTAAPPNTPNLATNSPRPDNNPNLAHTGNPNPANSTNPANTAQPAGDPNTNINIHTNTHAIPSSLAHLAPNNTYTDWTVNVRVQKHGLGQSFRVLIFLGDIAPNPADWDTEYNCVGRVSILGRAQDTQCSKCQDAMQNEMMVSGTVPLVSALLQDIVAGRLGGLKSEDVLPYLRNNLKWRVTLFTGSEVDVNSVPELKVSVVSTEMRIGQDGIPSPVGATVVHPEITDGVPGGLGQGEA